MKMKVVKFKNGKYGVRKFTWLGFLFAVNKTGDWALRSTGLIQEFDLDFANEVLLHMKDTDIRNKDMGR